MSNVLKKIFNFFKIFHQIDYVSSKNVTTIVPLIQINTEDKNFLFDIRKTNNKYVGTLYNGNIIPIRVTDNDGNQLYDCKDQILSDGITFYKNFLKPSGWELIPELHIYMNSQRLKTEQHESVLQY